MRYLQPEQAQRIITESEFAEIALIVDKHCLAIRCNRGPDYTGGDGYNLSTDRYGSYIEFATALYASVCFSQDTIQQGMDQYNLMLLDDCALGDGGTYTYRQGTDAYVTLPKCSGLGSDARVLTHWKMNDSAISLSRDVVLQILAL